VRNDDEDVLANQLSQEGGNSQADVFLTENSPALQRLQERCETGLTLRIVLRKGCDHADQRHPIRRLRAHGAQPHCGCAHR